MRLAGALLLGFALGGCAASIVGSDALAQTAGNSGRNAYPSVGKTPPAREDPAMTADELSKLKKELNDTRDRAQTQSGPANIKVTKP